MRLTTSLPSAPLSNLSQQWENLLGRLGLYSLPSQSSSLGVVSTLTAAPPAIEIELPAQWVSLPTQLGAAPTPQRGEVRPEPEAVFAASVVVAAPVPAMLTVHLLGAFRVAVNDHPMHWSRSRSQALFKYLLTHRERSIPRDVLMETFWPESDPDDARNCLNNALSKLKQALLPFTHKRVVIYERGAEAYGLNPDLCFWLDVEEFKRRVATGRRLEAAGSLGCAVSEYEAAMSLYQGDFLAEDPYEGWPVEMRERLRTHYLETLDRLSEIYFSREQYTACAELCQRILAHDNCREDAHCRLMRCYCRQSQYPMAVRQYQACVEALQTELDVSTAPATTQLFERIRRRECV